MVYPASTDSGPAARSWLTSARRPRGL